jgi:hypothetical protein
LFVLPTIPDAADVATKNMLAVRNVCALEGRCPVCGVTPKVFPDRKLGGVLHLVFRHHDGCPVLRDPDGWRDLDEESA